MCGIGGFLGLSGGAGISSRQLLDMAAAQAHRGPDGEGAVIYGENGEKKRCAGNETAAGRFGLMHRRLAILDISDAGLQPMSWPRGGASGGIDMVYNGEVYNYIEIRSELEKKGYQFSTGTDTEVILASYAEWGTNCFERFNGMWALAIFDWKRRRLVLSRDRMGIKPLHYSICREGLIFSSEIKGILQSGLVERTVNPIVAVDYLKWGLTNHRAETSFAGISNFPAGCFAEIDFESPKTIEPVSFWPLLDQTVKPNANSFDENAEIILQLLNQSVNRRLRSDVEVGSCLSGGVDSSAIVSIASEQAQDPLHTFTAASLNPAIDETKWANLVIEKNRSVAHTVTPDVDDLLENFSALVRSQEEPFGSASIFAQWCVMREANRNQIKVLLDGQGADEVFLGYIKFYPTYLKELLSQGKTAQFVKETLAFLWFGDQRIWKISEGFKYLPSWIYRSLPSTQAALSAVGKECFDEVDSPQRKINGSANMRKGDLLQYSLPALLRYEDRNSMAWSVEARVPFLDPDLVAFALEVPLDQMFVSGRPKAVLRKAGEGLIPTPILERRNKLGFEADQNNWMKGRLGERICERFQSDASRLESWYDMGKLNELIAGHRAKSIDAELFRLYTFSRWLEEFDLSLPS